MKPSTYHRTTRSTNERDFQRTVIELAQRLGWRVAHFRPARTVDRRGGERWQTPVDADGAGFPDLVLVRERVIFAELKTDNGRLRREQRQWLNAINGASPTDAVDAVVWRPKDWDHIHATLTGHWTPF